ncbi:MAG: hypothetical protein JNN30_16815 [Rhodanobacteraceae bacterium]|nr:hypothetical protein [Rhodanobacteraceae bacterium]
MAAKKSRTEGRSIGKPGDASDLMQSLLGPRTVAPVVSSPLHGIVIGLLYDFTAAGQPRIVVPGRLEQPCEARAICALDPSQQSRQCALMFESGDPGRPLILGMLHDPVVTVHTSGDATVHRDQDTFRVEAAEAIELNCGAASLRLSADGRVELRGSTVVSHSTGLNRIRGASIKLN